MNILSRILLCLVISHCSLSAAAEAEAAGKAYKSVINLWNHDIGPVNGGRFLEDQKYMVTTPDAAGGKQPGSGLFFIPIAKRSIPESECLPLFGIRPQVKVMDSSCKWHECKALDSKALGLPGSRIRFGVDIDGSALVAVTVIMTTRTYDFTTSGGSLWIDIREKVISELTTFNKREFRDMGSDIHLLCSWPEAMAQTADDALLSVGLKPPYYAPVTRDMLLQNWKKEIGLNVDSLTATTCYPTRGFNRKDEGAIRDAKDVLALGDSLDLFAGHSALTDDCFQK